MFLAKNGLSIPALELKINWARYISNTGVVDTVVLTEDCENLAQKVVGSELSYYDTFTRGLIAHEGLELVVSEPITMESVFVSPADGTRYPVGTTLIKAPSGKINRQTSVDGFNKTWFETTAHRFAALSTHKAICEKLAQTKDGRIYHRRAEQITIQIAALRGRLGMAYAPVSIYGRTTDGLSVSTPGFVWGDSSSRTIFDHSAVALASMAILTSRLDPEAVGPVTDILLPKLKDIAKSLSFAVNVDKASARTLTDQETQDFTTLAGSLVAMPLLAIDAMGSSSRQFDMDAVITQLTRIAAVLKGRDDVSGTLDLDATPRSLAELITLINGTTNFKFVDSVDAFYRRKEIPILPEAMTAQLAAVVMSVHPALVAGATVIGERTVRYVDGETHFDVVFPDRLGSGYSFLATEGSAQALATLNQINSFLQLAYAVITGSESISPLVLRQMGIRGVQRGASFALNAK